MNMDIMLNRMSVVAGVVFLQVVTLLRNVISSSTNLVFGLVNSGQRPRPLPPISNSILLTSAQDLAQKIRRRELTCAEVVSAFIARIVEVNPQLNAMVDNRFDDAVRDAYDADQFLSSTLMTKEQLAKEKPLLGVPFTIKENFQVRGLRQTVGLPARRDQVSSGDADAVVSMRKAGAILLGVTNLSELCTWWEARNNVYGQTNNPYDARRIAGGSSGGEGSLLGAAASVMGIGSDIGGSIRMPAFFNGVFGHKPSSHMVSNVGQLPEAVGATMDLLVTGPMCRYAADLALMLEVLAGPVNAELLSLDKPVTIKSLKIYYMEDDGGFPLVSDVSQELRETQKKVNIFLRRDTSDTKIEVVRHFEESHGVRTKKVCLPEMALALQLWAGKMTCHGVPTFCEEMAQKQGTVNIYTEFLRWCVGRSEHTFPAVALGFLEKTCIGRNGKDYDEIASICTKLRKDFEELLGDDGVFLYPSFTTVAPFHYQPLFMPFDFVYCAMFNVLGLPVTQCPLGLNGDGLPLGIQVVSALRNDRLCLAVARELEKAFGGWIAPSTILC